MKFIFVQINMKQVSYYTFHTVRVKLRIWPRNADVFTWLGMQLYSFIFLNVTVLVSCTVFSCILNISVDIIYATMTFITDKRNNNKK